MTEAVPASPFRQWYLVAVLTVVYMLSFVDRGVLSLIVNPIKADLQISDVQMSLLLGFSFLLLYSVLSIPAGYLADFVNRRIMLGGAVALWSCMASMCGFAGSYWPLFAGRTGLGVGEAALPPLAYSLLRDGVAPENRGRALGVYQTGANVGGGLGAFIGGSLYAAALGGAFAGLPLLGHLKPWQIVIAVPGLCGIALSALLLTIREPRRQTPTTRAQAASFGEVFRYLFQNWRIYGPIFFAVVTYSFANASWNSWMPAALGRIWGLPPSVVGRYVGTFNLVLFPVAAFVLGYLMDRLKKRGDPGAPFWVALITCLLNIGPSFFTVMAPSIESMWVGYGLTVFFTTSAVQIACGTMLVNVTPGRLIGKITSIFFLTNNLLGASTGVTVVAMVSQYGMTGPLALPHAMLLCYSISMMFTLALLFVGAREIRRWYRINGAAALG